MVLLVLFLVLYVAYRNVETIVKEEDQFYNQEDYYIFKLLPFVYSEDSEEANLKAFEEGQNILAKLTLSDYSRLLNAIDQCQEFEIIISMPNYMMSTIDLFLDELPPQILTYYEKSDKMYKLLKFDLENGKKEPVPLYFGQINSSAAGDAYLPLYEGIRKEEDILYSDYIQTGKALPVVVGYDLKDYLEVGKQYSAYFQGFESLFFSENGTELSD